MSSLFQRAFLLAATIGLAVAGPYTINYSPSRTCGTRGIQCRGYNAFECCEEPPSPSSFPGVRVTSSGPTGVVVFTEVSVGGGCGLCESTGAINTCYLNAPFNTCFVASITQCQASARMLERSDEKQAAAERHAECNNTVPLDTAVVAGQDYDLFGAGRLEMMADLVDLTDEEFAAKWDSMRKGPTPTQFR